MFIPEAIVEQCVDVCWFVRQVFMKSSAKKPSAWRQRIWTSVCSRTKSQKLRRCVKKKKKKRSAEIKKLSERRVHGVRGFPPRCATWCRHRALAAPSSRARRTRCISTSSWRSCGTRWRARWRAWYPRSRWRRRSTSSICSWRKVKRG